jgi:hypothetical protein
MNRFRAWARRWYRITRTATCGLLVGWEGAESLTSGMPADLPLRHSVHVVLMCLVPICFLLLQLELWGDLIDGPGFGKDWKRSDWIALSLLAPVGFAAWQNTHTWAVPLFGGSIAGIQWARSYSERRRHVLAVAGWAWAGMYPLLLSWPNEQRFYLTMLLGGLATTVQGVCEIALYFRAPLEPDTGV